MFEKLKSKLHFIHEINSSQNWLEVGVPCWELKLLFIICWSSSSETFLSRVVTMKCDINIYSFLQRKSFFTIGATLVINTHQIFSRVHVCGNILARMHAIRLLITFLFLRFFSQVWGTWTMSAVLFWLAKRLLWDKPERLFFQQTLYTIPCRCHWYRDKAQSVFSNRLSQGLLFFSICYMKNEKLRLPLRRFLLFFTKTLTEWKIVRIFCQASSTMLKFAGCFSDLLWASHQ